MKKFLAILLVAMMLVSMLPATALTAFAADGGTWTLVTNVNDLSAGDQVIIAAVESAVALSTTQNDKNRGQANITKSSDKKTLAAAPSSSVQIITLEEGKTAGTFSFNVGTLGYLYAAGGTGKNNYLKSKTTKDATASFNVTITSETTGAATIKCSDSSVARHTLMYNSSSSLFSCYASGQKGVCFYKLVAADPDVPACTHPADKLTLNNEDGKQHWYDCECGVQVDKEDHNYVNGYCKCGKPEPAGTNYELVTSVSQLAVGNQIIIVAKDKDVALSNAEKDNNRPEIAITKSGNLIKVEENSAVEIVTLEAGTVGGTFAFKTANGYLYAASSGSNYLKYETKMSANSSWKIEIGTDGVASVIAQGDNTRNCMQYNSGSSLFACYGSASQGAITLYKLAGGEDTHDCVDTTPKDHKCDTCGETVSECVDTTPKDHKCDVCGENYGPAHVAADKSHNCGYCGEKVTDCVDTTPKDHKCDVCGEDYGPAHVAADKSHNCGYCGAKMSEHEYDNIYDANCNICDEERQVPERVDALKNYATSLGGDIGFKMYFTLTEETLADANAYVSFITNGEEIERQYMTEAGAPDKDGEYAFMCGVAAAQMADEITVQLVYGDGTKGATGTYTVKQYVEQRLQNPEASAEEKALLKAMLNYGAYAQTFFEYNDGNLANNVDGVELPDLNAVTADKISQSNVQTGAATGITIKGYSALLEDETTFKFVFALSDGADIADYTFTYTDGTAAPVALEAKKAADGTYCVYIEDIAAALLDQRYTLTVTNTDGSSYSLTTSVLCYVKSVINNSNNTEAKINMAKALYLYNQAANAYFDK